MRIALIKSLSIFALAAMAVVCRAQEPTGLPLGLRYFMTQAQAIEQMKTLSEYRIKTADQNVLAYSVRDASSATTNGFILEFTSAGLVEISSTKIGMTKSLFDTYMIQMLKLASQWKAAGMSVVMEDKGNFFYLYKDLRSYAEISGTSRPSSPSGHSVSMTFSEIKHFEKARK